MDVAKRRRIMERLEAETPMVYEPKTRDNMVEYGAQESQDEADAGAYAHEFQKGEDAEDEGEWMNVVGDEGHERESVSPRRIEHLSREWAKKKFAK